MKNTNENVVEVPQNRLNLTNIIKFRKQNTKKIKSFIDIIDQDVRDIKTYPSVWPYIEQFRNEYNEDVQRMTAITEHEKFATALAYFSECEKWLAIYYMHTDEGKKPDKRAAIIEDLLYLYDLMAHGTLNYYLCELNEPIIWQDYTFYTEPTVKKPQVLEYVLNCTENISNLILAIDKCDNTKVFQTLQDISNTQMYATNESPFPEFE